MLELVQLTFVFGSYNREDSEALSNYDLFREFLTCTKISLFMLIKASSKKITEKLYVTRGTTAFLHKKRILSYFVPFPRR